MLGAKLDWDRLKVFQTIAETGSINAAAKSLGRSYGKVSTDLEELERALGHRLFERSPRGLGLTLVGEEVLRTARTMADAVQAIADRASERNPDQLVICAREGIASYWLARRLPELLQLQPDVGIFIKVMPTTPNLADGDADIAIQFEKPTAANIVARQLGWLHYILYAAPGYIATHGEPKSMSDLQSHKCLRLSSEEYQTECWKKAGDCMGRDLAADNGDRCEHRTRGGLRSGRRDRCHAKLCVGDRGSADTAHRHPSRSATVRFWLAYTERVRNMEASQPVLHWIRSCFDPVRNPCFREIYVPPQSRARRMEIANDRNPVVSTSANANLRQSISPPHAGDPGDKSDASERVQSLAAGEGGRVRTAMDKG